MLQGEQTLWTAVVAQALRDARIPNDTKAKGEKKARKEARDWLLGNSPDFRMACDLANLDPDAVREAWEDSLQQREASP
jgi:hypothetical protein